MSYFSLFEFFNPLLNLFVGVIFFSSLNLIGSYLIKKVKNYFNYRASIFIHNIISPIIGLLILSSIIQFLLLFGVNLHIIYTFITLVAILGFIGLKKFYRLFTIAISCFPKNSNLTILLYIVLFVGLLLSLSPLSKHDELFYHALLPSRLANDGIFHFYLYPLLSSMLPQMLYQVSITPLFIIGMPNSSNTVSFIFSLYLYFSLYYLLLRYTNDKKYSLIITIATLVGMHFFVFQTTMAPNSFNELSLFILALLIFKYRKINNLYMFFVSILSIAVIGSKLSYIPIVGLLLLIYSYYTVKLNSFRSLLSFLKTFSIVFIIFYFPLMVFSFLESGSPFGAAFAGVFGESVYNIEEVSKSLSGFSDRLPYFNLLSFYNFFKMFVLDFTPLITIALIFMIFYPKKKFLAISTVMICQLIVIYLKLPHDIRFFGGLLYFVAFVFWADMYKKDFFQRYSKIFYRVFYLIIAGYLSLALFYGLRFFPISLGLEGKESFFSKNIAMYEDYLVLDELLPNDSVILTCGGRLNGAYMPRDVIYDIDDFWWDDKELFLLSIVDIGKCEIGEYSLGKNVYKNDNAKITIYRTPFKEPDTGTLSVHKLKKETK